MVRVACCNELGPSVLPYVRACVRACVRARMCIQCCRRASSILWHDGSPHGLGYHAMEERAPVLLLWMRACKSGSVCDVIGADRSDRQCARHGRARSAAPWRRLLRSQIRLVHLRVDRLGCGRCIEQGQGRGKWVWRPRLGGFIDWAPRLLRTICQ